MHGLSGLQNSFAISFGLKGEMSSPMDADDVYILKLKIDDEPKQYISEEEAKEIFDMVTKSFMMANKGWHHYLGLSYEFDRENLTIIERVDRNNKGEWL